MRLEDENPAVLDRSGSEGSVGGSINGGGAVVVVGVTLDSRSRELLTWAMVKVAKSGDRVIALHILDPKADKSSLLSLVKEFDSMLAAYEGFCSLKQVDLKLKVCKGSPIRKTLSSEAKSCSATTLIIGASEIHQKIRSKISVAKYCAKNLPKNASVVCVDNGKIIFQRESKDSSASVLASHSVLKSRLNRTKTLPNSSSSLPPNSALSSSNSDRENVSMALTPLKTQSMPKPKLGWALLRWMFQSRTSTDTSSAKKSSLVQRLLKRPNRQSVAAIYPDRKQIPATYCDGCHLNSDPEKDANALDLADTGSSPYSSRDFSEELKALGEKYSTKCRLFDYHDLLLATNNFIPENLIGTGGSSQVYRGSLPGEKELAVKVVKPSEDLLKHFTSEVEIITSVHHKNIIPLVGFCFEENRLLLVYRLLSRGSLEENLHGTKKSKNLMGWEERRKVALGVAEALDHLHNSDESIMHGDVKSSNILLSENFEPQLSDFGLATRTSSYSHQLGATDVAGTFGYLAPEYFMHGKVNEKIDVYAFGVVLLELLSGRKPIDNELPKGQGSLVMWARQILKEGKSMELLDPNLVDAYDSDEFELMVLAAILCIQTSPQSRPEISLVLKLLQGDPHMIKWARLEMKTHDDYSVVEGEQSSTNIQSFINMALQDLEDDSASFSSSEPNISVEDYLGGRWSRSSSFD